MEDKKRDTERRGEREEKTPEVKKAENRREKSMILVENIAYY